ncbi:MAG: hypothetical protein IKK33_16585 [Lachnospiraceae bacterium]|nr:hypothetical protein [Lachnospiraceae bacterium]
MKKYKVLLFREWKVTKKFYITRTLLFLFSVAMFGVVAFVSSPKNGGPAVGAAADKTILALMLSFFVGCLSAILVAEDNGTYKSDVNSGWLNFSRALPITSFEKAVVKYLFRAMVILVGMILTVLSVAEICLMVGTPIQLSAIYAFFWVVNIVLVIDLIHQAIIIYDIDMKIIMRISDIGFVLFIVWCFLPIDISPYGEIKDIYGIIKKGYQGEAIDEAMSLELSNMAVEFMTISNLWGCLGFLLVIVILIVSFVVTGKGYERRKA